MIQRTQRCLGNYSPLLCSATWGLRRDSAGAAVHRTPLRGAGSGVQGNAGFVGEREEAEGLLQVQVDGLTVVTSVADRQVLAQVELVIAAAGGHEQGTLERRRPDDLPGTELAGEVIADREAVVGRLRDLRVLGL